jgi:exopolysaccharide production protein ExoQ
VPPKLAFLAFVAFMFWLFVMERKHHGKLPIALWIPVAWVVILGSRPMSSWFGYEGAFNSADDYLEGSPFDRMVFLALIGAACFVLWTRRMDWRRFVTDNRSLTVFFLYLLLSVTWADHPFVSFKRWVKDLGNVVMMLVIMTDRHPAEAAKAVFMRCSFLLIPVSVLYIKYFPDLGRMYDRWTGEVAFVGVTTNKNLLGMTLFVCALFQVWRAIELWQQKSRRGVEVVNLSIVGAMTLLLLSRAHSSTALVCTTLGASLMVGAQFDFFRTKLRRFGMYSVGLVGVLVLLHAMFNIGEMFVQFLGRDMTLTGRTVVWEKLLEQDVNLLFGVGYLSFWWGGRAERLFQEYSFPVNEAHNGYLETYLNTGLIGLFLLVFVLFSSLNRLSRDILSGREAAIPQFSFLVATVIYNFTEAAVNRPDLIWVVMLWALLKYTPAAASKPSVRPAIFTGRRSITHEMSPFSPL